MADSAPVKPKVYIAGPMRGLPFLNYPAFHLAAMRLRDSGYIVLNPSELESFFGPNGQIHDLIRRDVHVIVNELKPPIDGIVLLPGWEKSVGARAEKHLAEWCGLWVMTLKEALS